MSYKHDNSKLHEKEEQLTNLIKDIGENFHTNPELIAEYLEFSGKFYHYSPNNLKLIYMQNPNATFLQSYTNWRKLGYPPTKKGSGLAIWRPMRCVTLEVPDPTDPSKIVTKYLKDATPEERHKFEGGEITAHILEKYTIGYTFDISSTDYPVEDYPKLFSMGYPSETHSKITKGLEDFANNIGISVSYEDFNSISLRGNIGVYNNYRKAIKINSQLNDTQRLCTLAHELGHALEQHSKRDISLAQKEFEADAISILIQANYNLPLSDARKRHLAGHYRAFKEEMMEMSESFNINELHEKLDEVLDKSLEIFNDHVDDIDKCVEQYISYDELKINTVIDQESGRVSYEIDCSVNDAVLDAEELSYSRSDEVSFTANDLFDSIDTE